MDNQLQPKYSNKRVAFLVSTQSLIVAGGIGQFAQAFVVMANELGWVVDLILDSPLQQRNHQLIDPLLNCGQISLVYDCGTYTYNDHVDTFAFSDSINFEKEANFRSNFMHALKVNMYDLIVCNVPEAWSPVYATGLTSYIPTVFYTHNENLIGFEDKVGPYSQEYTEHYKRLLSLPGIIIGTQTPANVERMKGMCDHARVMAMPVADYKELVETTCVESHKAGVLFIGRWEERKNPQAYIKAMIETGLPAKVLTNKNGARKFEAAFKEAGFKNYIIKYALSGKEKAEFFAGCKVAFLPYRKEAFGYAALEASVHCHTILLPFPWTTMFNGVPNVHMASGSSVSALILSLYKKTFIPSLSYIQQYQKKTYSDWDSIFAHQPKLKPSHSTISQQDNFWYGTFIEGLNRAVSVEDIVPAYRIPHARKYTPTHTWLTTTNTMPNAAPEANANSLFD